MRMPVLVCAVLMQQRPPARSRPTPNADPIGDAITAKTTTPTAEPPIPRQGWGATVGGHEEEGEDGGQKGIDAGSVTSHEGPARIVRLSRPLPGAWKRGKYGGEIVGEEGHGPDVWSLAPAESSQTAIRRLLDLGTRDLASPSLPAIRPWLHEVQRLLASRSGLGLRRGTTQTKKRDAIHLPLLRFPGYSRKAASERTMTAWVLVLAASCVCIRRGGGHFPAVGGGRGVKDKEGSPRRLRVICYRVRAEGQGRLGEVPRRICRAAA
ncbi:hypothetical protein B0T11DRAFT_72557 [Plectosphaerella cucumerina]|uniref:Uncharacterized protein n=1 Tax=Plectosphaerella cucumerina TaxID=40658 RepID=A0A8K0X8T2_9PEZI|nr:hypothetical protein B0T11DRAFT_72557 [Plectosphaerella cucumerina]